MDYKQLLGVVAVVISLIGYIPYFLNIFKGKTKPHAFSWLVWGVLTTIAFAAQITSKGGAGAWVTGFSAFVCLTIFVLALWRGSKNFTLFDWLCLIGAGLALLLWAATDNPLTAVVLVTAIDLLGFIPTFRKSFIRPDDETLFTYSLGVLKFIFGILALEHFSTVTVLYPASLVVTNSIFVAMTLIRRSQLKLRES